MTTGTTKSAIYKRIGSEMSPNPPKVSIIIPAYNIAEFVAETLDSVLAQTFKDFEIIIINDGSPDSDQFEKVLEPYLEKIIYLRNVNVGAGAARNVAIEHSRSKLLAFLDGDDVWLPEFLQSQIKFIEDNNYDLVYCDALLFGGSALDGKTYMQTSPSSGEANFESLLDLKCSVITSGTIAKKQLVIEAGMFELEKVRAHDFHLWLRMAKHGAKIGYQRKILLKYRVRLESLTGNAVQQIQREIDVYHRVKRMIKLDKTQEEIVERQIARLNEDFELECGKSFLLHEDFGAAKMSFEKANKLRRSIRLKIITKILGFAPRLILKAYKIRRPNEIAPASQNQK